VPARWVLIDLPDVREFMRFLADTLVDDKFRIESLIGEGGFGSVYKAIQLDLDRAVAIKFVHDIAPDGKTAYRERLHREALTLSRLRHRNIVSFYACGYWNDTPYIVLELVNGTPLSEVLAANPGSLTFARILNIACQICEALVHAHRAGVIHRDIKPGNILLCPGDDSNEFVRVIDFGLARLLPVFGAGAQKLTATGTTVGSVLYMSPEQCAQSNVDERSDIYSVGAVLYHCVVGEPPFSAIEDMAVKLAHQMKQPAPLKPFGNIPQDRLADLEKVIFKAMSKNKGDRYNSATELLADLQDLSAGRAPTLADKKTISPAVPTNKRNLRVLTGLCLLAMLVTSVGFIAFKNAHDVNTQSGSGRDVETTALVMPAHRLRSVARKQHEQGDVLGAIETLRPILRSSSTGPDEEKTMCLQQLGEYYYELGKFVEARDCFGKSVDVCPKENVRDWKRAIRLHRDVCTKLKDFGPAFSQIRKIPVPKADQVRPEVVDIANKLSNEGELQKLREIAWAANSVNPCGELSPWERYHLATMVVWHLSYVGRLTEASEELARAERFATSNLLKSAEVSSSLVYMKAVVYERSKKILQWENLLKGMISNGEIDQKTRYYSRYLLADGWLRMGRRKPSEIVAILEPSKFGQLTPLASSIYAEALCRLGRSDKAFEIWQEFRDGESVGYVTPDHTCLLNLLKLRGYKARAYGTSMGMRYFSISDPSENR
jgi:serine/threonine protein kinase